MLLQARRVNGRDQGLEDCVDDLLRLCRADQEIELIVDLLQRFTVVTEEDLERHLNDFIRHIEMEWNHSMDKVILLGTAADHEPDSSQALLQSMKYSLARQMKSPEMMNQLSQKRLKKYLVSPEGRSVARIVIVDEFAGTGKTLLSRVNSVRNMIADFQDDSSRDWDIEISVAIVAAMDVALTRLERAKIQYFCSYPLRRGITGYDEKERRRNRCMQMMQLESRLSRKHENATLPSFGYGASQALFSRPGQNVPNNVFPIFWWKYLTGNELRNTVLHRFESRSL